MSNHISSVTKLRTLSKTHSKQELKPLDSGREIRTHKRIQSDFSSSAKMRTVRNLSKHLINPLFKPPINTARENSKKRVISRNMQFHSWKMKSLMFSGVSPIVNKEIHFERGLNESSPKVDDTLMALVQGIDPKAR